MASSGLRGPFPLTEDSIKNNVIRRSPGAYALGHQDGNTFYISYVGRSDTDVGGRLRDHVGASPQFKYGYYAAGIEVFEKECRLYHDFGSSGNKRHPDRPAGKAWECPVCTIFD